MGTSFYGIKEKRKRQYKKNYGLQLLNLKRKTEAIERKMGRQNTAEKEGVR